MTVSDSDKLEEEFTEAKNNWELEKLYVDLSSVKGKALTPVEKKFLRGLLCGFSPAEIANTVYQSRSSSTVRVYLSNGLYKYLEELLSNQAGDSVKVKNWSRVTHLLEKAGYKKAWAPIAPVSNQIQHINSSNETDLNPIKAAQTEDWGEAIDVSFFYGRKTELAQMSEWIVKEHCRLVVLLGMGGIGKTALSVKLAEQIKDKFDYVIWRCLGTSRSASTLHLAPRPEVFLNQLIQVLSPTQPTQNTENLNGLISQLIYHLRSSRCLIVLDNLNSVLDNEYICEPGIHSLSTSQSDTQHSLIYDLPQIHYRSGYEGYGELIRRVGNSQHQSCLLFTSREKPQDIAVLEGVHLPVRCLKLTGLTNSQSTEILKTKGLTALKEEESKLLTYWYAGNPLFIKLVATAIQDLFAGNIYEFLEQGTLIFGEIRAILDQQFYRLSSLEKQVMYWLALNQDLNSMRKLQRDLIPRVPQRLVLETIELLQRRSLIERKVSSFSQTPVFIEYVAERLIEENLRFIGEQASSLAMSHAIFESQIKNYIRDLRLNNEI